MTTKVRTLYMIALILFFTLTCASRPDPAFHSAAPMKNQNMDHEVEVDFCDGYGEEECLMRRTLVAHPDYIYTQKQKP